MRYKTLNLFENVLDSESRSELTPGAALLLGFARTDEAILFLALYSVITEAPFRHMMTKGGFRMSVAHAKDWIDAWNSHDLERILAHYSQDIVFEVETAKTRWNSPDGKLRGIAELRKHFALGLQLAPTLNFRLEQVFLSPSGCAVLYQRDHGNRVIDCP